LVVTDPERQLKYLAMAKRFVQISLGTKLRTIFAAGVLLTIAVALLVPWYFMEMLAEQGVQSPAETVTQMALNEWLVEHTSNLSYESRIASLYTQQGQIEGRSGPRFVKLSEDLTATPPLDSAGREALKAFARSGGLSLSVIGGQDDRGRRIYRCFRSVRVGQTCQSCHGGSVPVHLQYHPGQLVGMIDMTVPGSEAGGPLVWLIRVAIVVGGVFAAVLSAVTFAVVSGRLILRPVRHLRDIADKVAEGDMSVRSTVSTGDELERLGESFNEMLTTLADQHAQLRQANRALDLRLSELSEANVTLHQANQVKTEFLANVSHELRTPLNSVIGFADLLADSPEERVRRYAENIASSAKQLLSMINDLLDLAKVEAGKAQVNPAKVSVADACETLLALMEPLATKHQIRLKSELFNDLPVIRTDPGKLQQILYNLLSNALKFTPAGGEVVVRARCQTHYSSGKDVEQVVISVSDTGPGIPEAEQQHIFEKFYQADRTLTREASGTGLGLAIAKELTQLLGGQLDLTSSAGQGATFTIKLPVDLPARKDKTPNER